MEKRIILRLVRVNRDRVEEEVTVWMDPDDAEAAPELLRRHYIAMAARAEHARVRDEVADMPWLHDYRLDLIDPDRLFGDPIYAFREA